MPTNFLSSKVCLQRPAMFCLYTFLSHNLNFHRRWRWWIQFRHLHQAIFLIFFYFIQLRFRKMIECYEIMKIYEIFIEKQEYSFSNDFNPLWTAVAAASSFVLPGGKWKSYSSESILVDQTCNNLLDFNRIHNFNDLKFRCKRFFYLMKLADCEVVIL